MQLRLVCCFTAKGLCSCHLFISTDYLPDHKSKMPLLVVRFPPCILSSGGRIPLNGNTCCVLTSLKALSIPGGGLVVSSRFYGLVFVVCS
jgi:hypothetical protein